VVYVNLFVSLFVFFGGALDFCRFKFFGKTKLMISEQTLRHLDRVKINFELWKSLNFG
jgi:hypothetical protein